MTGEIGLPQSIPRAWESFFLKRAERAFEHTISEERQEQIREWMMERPKRALESESFQTWEEEMQRKIENHDPTNYLDVAECPVCFTNHRVVDSLPERPITDSEVDKLADGFVFCRPIYLRGELEHPEMPTNITPAIVMSTEEMTTQIALYTDVGWVVEKEVELTNELEPDETSEQLWEATYESYVEFAEEQKQN
ncbi:MAG: hypothetical protein ACLFR5_08035 [Halobacteriales archaeon]